MFIKEYYPVLYEQLKGYIAGGRWNISGPGLDGFDVNIPAPESLIRSILYAQQFYRNEFGCMALDAFLPDCFGFGFAFPTLAKHCGLNGFSTQKLGWGCAVGIPFRVGFWEGVDGAVLPVSLHAEPYTSIIREDFTRHTGLKELQSKPGRLCGVPRAYRYYGTGDKGGAPDEGSVAWLQGFQESDGPLKVKMACSGELFDELNAAEVIHKPLYRGELLLSRHGTGATPRKA